MLVFGVLLPGAAVAVETTTHVCANAFFNPLPDGPHLLLVSLVPLANFLAWLTLKAPSFREHAQAVQLLNGMAIGVAFMYSLIFFPLAAICGGFVLTVVAALLLMGLPLLAYAPLSALISAICLRAMLRKLSLSGAVPRPGVTTLLGVALSVLTLSLTEMPSTLTRIGVQMATDPKTSAQGVQFLRAYGNEEVLLRMCYEFSGNATDVIGSLAGFGRVVSTDDARKIFYRVTGTPFNSVQIPASFKSSGWGRDDFCGIDQFDRDADVASDTVGGVASGLSLSLSHLESTIDPDAALAYSEWTIVFTNDSAIRSEARAQFLLPEGSVVSRLTLWINGQPHEAAFGERGKTRAAYTQVVRRRRDPVLVTSDGPNRIMMQCFPVDPHASMKVRVGITSPLVLSDLAHGLLALPVITERNFRVACKHLLHLASKSWLAISASQPKHDLTKAREVLYEEISNEKLSQLGVSVLADRNDFITTAWSADPFDKQ